MGRYTDINVIQTGRQIILQAVRQRRWSRYQDDPDRQTDHSAGCQAETVEQISR